SQANPDSGLELFQQPVLRRMRGRVARRGAMVLAAGVQQPRLHVVVQVVLQRFPEDARGEKGVAYRETRLDAPQQIALHPVGRRAVEFRVAALANQYTRLCSR